MRTCDVTVRCQRSCLRLSSPRSSADSSGESAWRPTTRSRKHYKTFTAALRAVESTYVGKVDSDRLVYGGGARHARHARSAFEFFDPREYAQMRERQEGGT